MGREDDLLTRFRDDGHAASMETLVGLTRPRLVGVARRIGAPQDAEDSVQATYHALLRRDERPDDVVGWLVATVVRIAYRRKATARRESALAERLARPCDESDAARAAVRGEEDALVRAAVHRLPARYRDAVVLHHLEGLPLADVARLLDVPEATAKTRVQRGRALLRMRLAPMLAYGFLFVPWAAADFARACPDTLVAGGVMKSKLAAAGVLAFALGAGVGIGAAGTTLLANGRTEDGETGLAAATSESSPPSKATPGSETTSAPRGVDRETVRQMIVEALADARSARSAATGAAPVPPVRQPANPELNSDLERRASVTQTVDDLRNTLIEYGLEYEFDRDRVLVPGDAARRERYSVPGMWISRYLGWVERDPARYEWLTGDARGFDGKRENGAWAFAGPMTAQIAAEQYESLFFADGVAAGAVVLLQSYATVHCKGPMDGKLGLESYGTVVVEGDVNGEIAASSYNCVLIKGRLAGRYSSKSSATAYVMGGLAGKLVLDTSNAMVYVAGFTPESALEGLSGKAGKVILESSDLSVGTHRRGSIDVVVRAPR